MIELKPKKVPTILRVAIPGGIVLLGSFFLFCSFTNIFSSYGRIVDDIRLPEQMWDAIMKIKEI